MLLTLATRFWRETDHRLLRKFIYNFGWKGMGAVNKFKRRLKRGDFFPAFIFMSITDDCNLKCQGCWVGGGKTTAQLSPEAIDKIITQSKPYGCSFFGILGGEPLLYKGLWDVLEKYPDRYFQLYTNGTLLDDAAARNMKRLGNITPLLSLEGNETVSDTRRGGKEVFQRTLDGLDRCRDHGLITGVATSVCKSNFDFVVQRDFIDSMVKRGVHYLWYYVYRPVGPDPHPELTLDAEQILALRRFIVEQRLTAPIILVDAYWDHLGRAVCPAAMGISHHVNTMGDIEPCPPIQFARENVNSDQDLEHLLSGSEFLRRFRELAADNSRGCILLENPQLLKEFVEKAKARDTSGRDTGLSELAAMTVLPGHNQPGEEIPEKSWFYRFGKKHWFFGFGAYG